MDYLLFLQGLREATPDAVNLLLYYLTEFVGSALPLAIGLVIFWCVDKKNGYLILSSYLACTAINQIVKNIACVYRPWILDARIQPYGPALPGATGYSFPSGHTAIAVGFFGSLALWFKEMDKKKLAALFVVLIFLVGFSRNWLGCHTPQDVLCSLALATVTLFATRQVLIKVEENPNYDLIASAVFLVASIVFTAYCCLKSYPLDYDAMGNLLVDPNDMMMDCFKAFGGLFAVSIAWPIERHFIRFSSEGCTKARVVRGVVGVVAMVAAYAVGKFALPLFLPLGPAKFGEYALLVFMAVVIYPALFTWFENRKKRPDAADESFEATDETVA